MSGRAFIDTNIFIYTQRSDEPAKSDRALSVIDRLECVTSTQVMNELCNVFTKKYPLPTQDIREILHSISMTSKIVAVSVETVASALNVHERYGFSYYDSLIVTSALESGCDCLLSEDLSDGQLINGKLKIVNIFVHPDF